MLASVAGVSLSGSAAQAKDLIVNSRADPGDGVCNRSQCTLREAIGKANGRVGLDQVRFRIGKGPTTIKPATPLPPVTDATTLNGWAQRGFKRAPLVELSGASAGPGSSGLVIDGPEVTIKGMVINRFAGNGIDVGGASFSGKATIQGSYVGTDRKGKLDRGNGDHGVLVRYLAGVTIGGPAPKQRVVVSGNDADGVRLEQSDVGGFPSSIIGSRIGTNAAGTVAVPNVGDGIHWSYPWGATIGGPASGPDDNANNLISGNGGAGIALLSNCLPICAAQNVIDGNRIGTNRAGTAALPNADEGIYMAGTGDTVVGGGVGNLISGNGSHGVYVQNAAGGSILGNAVGINSAIDGVIPNGDDGIHLEPGPGGFHVGGGGADSNVVGGNGGHGIYVGTTNTQLYSNYVGVYPGRTNLGNSLNGIQLAGDALVGGTGPSQANEIAFNDGNGIGVAGGVSGISANSIHDNGGIGIDLGNDGATTKRRPRRGRRPELPPEQARDQLGCLHRVLNRRHGRARQRRGHGDDAARVRDRAVLESRRNLRSGGRGGGHLSGVDRAGDGHVRPRQRHREPHAAPVGRDRAGGDRTRCRRRGPLDVGVLRLLHGAVELSGSTGCPLERRGRDSNPRTP